MPFKEEGRNVSTGIENNSKPRLVSNEKPNFGKGPKSGEPRKRSVPGARELILKIRSIGDEITNLDQEIKLIQEQIQTLISEERSKSPKNKLSNDLRSAIEEKKAIATERRLVFDSIAQKKKEIDAIKSERSGLTSGYNSIGKLNSAIEEFEHKLIVSKLTPKEEGQITSKLISLKIERNKLGESEDMLAKAEELESEIKEYKKKLEETSSLVAEKNNIIDSIKIQLDKLTEDGKVKLPAIVKLENQLDALKNQKNSLFTQRNTVRDNLHNVEEEFSKIEAQILVQKELEDDKETIRKRITNLKFEKDTLLSEKDVYNPKIFDNIISSLKGLKMSDTFSLDINLVTHLMKQNVSIPSSVDSLDSIIRSLLENKKKSEVDFKNRIEGLNAEIASINGKIEDEIKKINSMPPTDFEILKKGGFRNK